MQKRRSCITLLGINALCRKGLGYPHIIPSYFFTYVFIFYHNKEMSYIMTTFSIDLLAV
jgi:hypothetical protein